MLIWIGGAQTLFNLLKIGHYLYDIYIIFIVNIFAKFCEYFKSGRSNLLNQISYTTVPLKQGDIKNKVKLKSEMFVVVYVIIIMVVVTNNYMF